MRGQGRHVPPGVGAEAPGEVERRSLLFPIELRAGPFAINAHGVMTAVGIWVGWLLARAEADRKGLDRVFLDGLIFAVILGGLVGARLDYVLFSDLGGYLRDPWSPRNEPGGGRRVLRQPGPLPHRAHGGGRGLRVRL